MENEELGIASNIGDAAERPRDLPADARLFWAAPVDLDEIAVPPKSEATPALTRLGPLPFARRGFPLMGFFATVYEHIADYAREAWPSEPNTPRRTVDDDDPDATPDGDQAR